MILLWLVPPLVVTLAAMVWVSWLGREGRGEVDREVALRRMAAALDGTRRRRRSVPGYAVPHEPRDRSTGVAVRPSRPVARPAARPVARPEEAPPPERRAS